MKVIARFTLREALRRKVFTVVAWLTASFLVLYGLAVWQAFRIDDFTSETIIGATMFGLAMFGILFLGVVLAVFLTLGAIRGDAERGLLQPLLVRPVTRTDEHGSQRSAALVFGRTHLGSLPRHQDLCCEQLNCK